MLKFFLLIFSSFSIIFCSSLFETFEAEIGDKKNIHLTRDEYQALFNLFFKGLKPDPSPKIVIFEGGYGTGKTYFRQRYFTAVENFHINNIDLILEKLPGYQIQKVAEGPIPSFNYWWPIAEEIADQFMQFAINQQFNILYDHTCATEKSLHDLRMIIGKGYRGKMYAFFLPLEEALLRKKNRDEKEEKFTTNEIINLHNKNLRVFT
jgi:predicted kinase